MFRESSSDDSGVTNTVRTRNLVTWANVNKELGHLRISPPMRHGRTGAQIEIAH